MSETALLSPLEPVVRASIADQVFDVLHQQVLSLALPPGTKMSEAEIAKQLNVSRQPVRDAFYRLSKLGFLLIQPQKATQVSPIHIQDILRARFVRTSIEVEVMRRAAQGLTAQALAQLEVAVQRGQRPVRLGHQGAVAGLIHHPLEEAAHKAGVLRHRVGLFGAFTQLGSKGDSHQLGALHGQGVKLGAATPM